MMQRLLSLMLYVAACVFASLSTPAQAEESRHLLPSEVSELEYVYNALRSAARDGNVEAYTAFLDPQEISQMTTRSDGSRVPLTGKWLQSHAREWPSIEAWDFIEMRKSAEWARLVLRHPHTTGLQVPSKRWDLYVLLFRHIDGDWHLTRRAIFVAPGQEESPPQLDDVPIPSAYALPTP